MWSAKYQKDLFLWTLVGLAVLVVGLVISDHANATAVGWHDNSENPPIVWPQATTPATTLSTRLVTYGLFGQVESTVNLSWFWIGTNWYQVVGKKTNFLGGTEISYTGGLYNIRTPKPSSATFGLPVTNVIGVSVKNVTPTNDRTVAVRDAVQLGRRLVNINADGSVPYSTNSGLGDLFLSEPDDGLYLFAWMRGLDETNVVYGETNFVFWFNREMGPLLTITNSSSQNLEWMYLGIDSPFGFYVWGYPFPLYGMSVLSSGHTNWNYTNTILASTDWYHYDPWYNSTSDPVTVTWNTNHWQHPYVLTNVSLSAPDLRTYDMFFSFQERLETIPDVLSMAWYPWRLGSYQPLFEVRDSGILGGWRLGKVSTQPDGVGIGRGISSGFFKTYEPGGTDLEAAHLENMKDAILWMAPHFVVRELEDIGGEDHYQKYQTTPITNSSLITSLGGAYPGSPIPLTYYQGITNGVSMWMVYNIYYPDIPVWGSSSNDYSFEGVGRGIIWSTYTNQGPGAEVELLNYLNLPHGFITLPTPPTTNYIPGFSVGQIDKYIVTQITTSVKWPYGSYFDFTPHRAVAPGIDNLGHIVTNSWTLRDVWLTTVPPDKAGNLISSRFDYGSPHYPVSYYRIPYSWRYQASGVGGLLNAGMAQWADWKAPANVGFSFYFGADGVAHEQTSDFIVTNSSMIVTNPMLVNGNTLVPYYDPRSFTSFVADVVYSVVSSNTSGTGVRLKIIHEQDYGMSFAGGCPDNVYCFEGSQYTPHINVLVDVVLTDRVNTTTATFVLTNYDVAAGTTALDYAWDGARKCMNEFTRLVVHLEPYSQPFKMYDGISTPVRWSTFDFDTSMGMLAWTNHPTSGFYFGLYDHDFLSIDSGVGLLPLKNPILGADGHTNYIGSNSWPFAVAWHGNQLVSMTLVRETDICVLTPGHPSTNSFNIWYYTSCLPNPEAVYRPIGCSGALGGWSVTFSNLITTLTGPMGAITASGAAACGCNPTGSEEEHDVGFRMSSLLLFPESFPNYSYTMYDLYVHTSRPDRSLYHSPIRIPGRISEFIEVLTEYEFDPRMVNPNLMVGVMPTNTQRTLSFVSVPCTSDYPTVVSSSFETKYVIPGGTNPPGDITIVNTYSGTNITSVTTNYNVPVYASEAVFDNLGVIQGTGEALGYDDPHSSGHWQYMNTHSYDVMDNSAFGIWDNTFNDPGSSITKGGAAIPNGPFIYGWAIDGAIAIIHYDAPLQFRYLP